MTDTASLPIAASAADILNKRTLKEQVVDVPEWGCSVKIREFTKMAQQQLRERAMLRANTRDGRKKGDIDTARLEMLSFVGGVIEPTFAEADIPALRELSSGALDRVIKAILDLNGLNQEAVEAAEADFPGES